MRLDHLLSKEHSSAVCLQRSNTAKPFREHMFPGGAHGWNIDIDAQSSLLNPVRLVLLATPRWSGLVVDDTHMHAVGS